MTTKPKIFISFSTGDRQIAQSLYYDLFKAGADVFQFQESATPGMAAWDEVLANIETSDVFILLASKGALKSRPVQEEIKFAYYQYVNDTRPATMIPLMLERDLRLPRELRAINQISLDPYKAGLQQLIKYLGLESSPNFERGHREKVVQPSSKFQFPDKPQAGPHKKPLQRDRFSELLERAGSGNVPNMPIQSQGIGALRNRFLPKTDPINEEPVSVVLAKYSVVIGMFAFLGAIIGWFANSWLASLEFGEITGVIRVLSGQWSWLPWVSRIVCLISVAWITFYITDSETPVDKADYALVSAKSVGVALALGLIWSFLFSKITGGTVTFVLISVGIAAATVLVYAILEEL